VLAFSSFPPKLKLTGQKQIETASEVIFSTNLQRIKTEREREREGEREREERHKAIIQVPSTKRK
jgi:hypothetical protein